MADEIDYRMAALSQINDMKGEVTLLDTHFCYPDRVINNQHGIFYARQRIQRLRELLLSLDACCDGLAGVRSKTMVTKAHTINIESKSREATERKLAEEFNAWTKANPNAVVFHLFEPERFDRKYGDYTYNTYHTAWTFFYREEVDAE